MQMSQILNEFALFASLVLVGILDEVLGPVHTYLDISESANLSFQVRLPSTRIRWNRHTNPHLFESALQSWNFWSRSSPVLYRQYCIRDGNLVPRFSQDRARCKFCALYDASSFANIPRGVLGTRVNPDTCGRANSIWIRIRVNVEIFESGKKKVADSKIAGYVSTGP